MNSDLASCNAFLPSLSGAAAPALPLGPSACETRQKRTAGRSSELRVGEFRKKVWKYWRENGRHDLAWRKTEDPYRILVSEVMLQQTQVSRVCDKYREFLKAFPNIRTLAKAPLADVLETWSGMGYNRRAKYLRDAAIEIVQEHDGKVPNEYAALRALPGVGDYTARAIRVFSCNEPDILVETNIRAAFIHHFFISPSPTDRTSWGILDTDIHAVAMEAAKGQDPREWHWALMDYGAYLKRSGVRNNHRSAHYVRQSKFEGSLRQARGAILRELHNDSKSENSLRSDLKNSPRSDLGKFRDALASLARDGLIAKQKGKWRIA